MAVRSGDDSINFLWRWPEDARRVAPVPAGAELAIALPPGAEVRWGGEGEWRKGVDGVVRVKVPAVEEVTLVPLGIRWKDGEGAGGVLVLPSTDRMAVPPTARDAHGICANRSGASVQARAAFGTIESKYDALLAANLNPAGPDDRRIILTRVRQWLRRGGEVREVTGAAVTEFAALSHRELEWRFDLLEARWAVRVTLGDGNEAALHWHSWQALEGDWEFIVRPDLENRSFHCITQAFTGPEQAFREAVTVHPGGFEFDLGSDWNLEVKSGAAFTSAPEWQYMVALAQEVERGLQPATDLFSPGEFRWGGGDMEISAAVTRQVSPLPALPVRPPVLPMPAGPILVGVPARPIHSLPEQMQAALELFLAERDGGLTVIAGFPWFLDWGRDSLIFARGLAAAGRVAEALSVVKRFAEFESEGSIPNLIRGADVANRETSDAPLWLVVALRDLAARNPNVLEEMAGSQTLAQVACEIVRAHVSGTHHGVRLDESSGLLWSPAHYTWMDTDRPAGTPREGYPIEIQALWVAVLEFVHRLDGSAGWDGLARRARHSGERLFWREAEGFLSDCLHGAAGTPAEEAIPDDHLRPNQLFAITLGLLRDRERALSVLQACQCLLIPGAVRTLAPRRVSHPLPVKWNGTALHNPHEPYHGEYTGPEDSRRKPAYHNGTAWTWLYPSYCEALALVSPSQRDHARALMNASAWLLRGGCAGQLAEIADGDMPHALRGCGAQAWSASEWLRVWALLR
jgi:starch synthase (maltosyl-transferring)